MPQDGESSSSTATGAAEASVILAIASDVCERLSITWVPHRVFWDELPDSISTTPQSTPILRGVSPGYPEMFMDTLYVSPSLKGRLEPEEWRPIVASSMIYYAKFATKKDLEVIFRVSLILLLVGVGLLGLLLEGVDFRNLFLLEFIAFGAYFLARLFVVPYQRGLWLKADRLAADFAGILVMISALEKVHGFQKKEPDGRWFSDKPGLGQRIERLKQYWTRISGLS